MPKKRISESAEASAELGAPLLPAWQIAGLSLAVLVGHVFNGSGAVVFGVVAVGVIWTLYRLHAHAPESRSTAALIASAPGAAPARTVSILQFVAYLVIGAYAAKSIASMMLPWLSGPNDAGADWWGPALAVAAVAVTAILAGALPTRLLAPVATVLAGFGLLVYFYVALAVIAKVASGTMPVDPLMRLSTSPAQTEWGTAALLVSLALAYVAFEVPTTVSDRLGSVRSPLGAAIGLVTLCSVLAWVATNMGTAGEFRYDAGDLVVVATEMLRDLGGVWFLAAATIAQAVAALLVLIWGATRVVRRPGTESLLPLVSTAVSMGVLAVAVCTSWGAPTLWGVGALLLFVVYLAAAHANSRLDDSSTISWAWFATMAIMVAVIAFLTGASEGWWPVGVAVLVVAAAAAWAVQSGKSERLRRENRTS
ncbi:hypothetical protein ACIA48_21820 [Mycobacterium sp. NPDC051804]|uniref:hypothetical protein n=1 Tax=Mycobacterium sp. NPDC051804 TaxID=3364295 RepID=UPI0037A50995